MTWGIASKLSVVSSLLVLVATATVGYMVYRGARDSLMAASAERLRHTTDGIEVRFRGELDAVRKDLRFVAATPPVIGFSRTRAASWRGYRLDPATALTQREWRAQIETLFSSFLANRPAYLEISLIAAEDGGREIIRMRRGPGGIRQIPRDSLRAVAAEGDLSDAWRLKTGATYLSRVTWREWPAISTAAIPTMAAAAPVVLGGGVPAFLVKITVDMRRVLDAIEPMREEGRSIYLADGQGRLLMHPQQKGVLAQPPGGSRLILSEFPELARLLNGPGSEPSPSVNVGEDADVLSYFERFYVDRGLRREPFVAGVTSPHATFLNGVREVQVRSLWITVLFCLAGVLLALVLAQYLTRPLSRITAALSNLGDRSRTARLPVARSDEIGVLARTFRVMEEQIRLQMEELEEKERRQRIILETAAEGIIVADAEGTIETFNRAAEHIFGYPAAEVVGRNVSVLLASGARIERLTMHAQPGGDGAADLAEFHEAIGRRKDGSTVAVSLAVSAFSIAGHRKYAGFVQDITERKSYEGMLREAKERAEEMARLKSAFLANMSHEIRTPLTSVLGYAALLARDVDPPRRRFAETIIQSGRRLMDTLNSVLALAQLEANKVKIEMRPLALGLEVREIVQMFQSVAGEKGLDLRLSIAPSAESACALLDRGAFSSVLQNLLGNAVKFTEKGGVEVRLRTSDRRVFVDVSDSGIGIDREFLPHIFDEFRQESTGMDRSHEGAGLGLAITRRLVLLMDGSIRVESTKSRGTTFMVSFPQAVSDEETPGAVEVPPARTGTLTVRELRVLLVEDNADTAALIAELLEGVGTVTHVTSVSDAVAAAEASRYDLVLMDINLGKGGNGADALRHLRRMEPYAALPVVAMTAYALPGDEQRFLAIGFTDYLSKPFSVEDLLDVVARHSRDSADILKSIEAS